ncbi:MAG: hypothetical protein IT432_02175 [Phycisphaerales bacterium]|nr:hypothetical protein [Phycisphaerales bacterium]
MTMPRHDIARLAAAELARRSDGLSSLSCVVGFDGFIDTIIDVVDRRRTMCMDDYAPIDTIERFALRAAGAAGKSTNIELVDREDRFGGNGPLLASGIARIGPRVTYIGAVGVEGSPTTLHPLFGELARRCDRVVPVAPPAHTDALEFRDGKIMLGKTRNIQAVTWELLKERIGVGVLCETLDRASLLGMVNWVMMGGAESIWRGLLREVFPCISPSRVVGGIRRRVFIDLCDPAKRLDTDITRAIALLREMNDVVPVTLGLNLAEAERISSVLGIDAFSGPSNQSLGAAVRHAAEALQRGTGLECVAIHPREGAAGADCSGASAWFDGPFTLTPRLSTGAGDHFNAGFSFAQTINLPIDQCLAVGCAVSGAYVRDADSPTLERLTGFLRELPEPEK